MSEPIYVSESVRASCERLQAHFRGAIARDVATRGDGMPAVPWPPELVQGDVLAPTLSEGMPVPSPGHLEIRLYPAVTSSPYKFQVYDASGRVKGRYRTIKRASKEWPRAIVTRAARLRALELEHGAGGSR